MAPFLQEYEKAMTKLERLERTSAASSKSESVCWNVVHKQLHECGEVACMCLCFLSILL